MVADSLARARKAYERGRLRAAVAGVSPLPLVVAGALFFGSRGAWVLPIGALLLIAAAFGLFRGGAFGRAVLPGVAAGLLPLCSALMAQGYGHVCLGGSCLSLCVPACTVSGLVAGGFIAWSGVRARAGATFWLAGFGLALLTGSLGCCCVGYSGVAGLFGGLAVSLLPTFFVARRAVA